MPDHVFFLNVGGVFAVYISDTFIFFISYKLIVIDLTSNKFQLSVGRLALYLWGTLAIMSSRAYSAIMHAYLLLVDI